MSFNDFLIKNNFNGNPGFDNLIGRLNDPLKYKSLVLDNVRSIGMTTLFEYYIAYKFLSERCKIIFFTPNRKFDYLEKLIADAGIKLLENSRMSKRSQYSSLLIRHYDYIAPIIGHSLKENDYLILDEFGMMSENEYQALVPCLGNCSSIYSGTHKSKLFNDIIRYQFTTTEIIKHKWEEFLTIDELHSHMVRMENEKQIYDSFFNEYIGDNWNPTQDEDFISDLSRLISGKTTYTYYKNFIN